MAGIMPTLCNEKSTFDSAEHQERSHSAPPDTSKELTYEFVWCSHENDNLLGHALGSTDRRTTKLICHLHVVESRVQQIGYKRLWILDFSTSSANLALSGGLVYGLSLWQHPKMFERRC